MPRIRIDPDEAFQKYQLGEVTMIDQLTTNQHEHATRRILGAIQIPAAELPDRLAELPHELGVISYCT